MICMIVFILFFDTFEVWLYVSTTHSVILIQLSAYHIPRFTDNQPSAC